MKKNVLVITLGNSDVQLFRDERSLQYFVNENEFCINSRSIEIKINRNYKDWFLLKDSRAGGKVVLENYDRFINYLRFPLVQPLIDKIKSGDLLVNLIVWVFTDQIDSEAFKFSDTLYYADILEKYIKSALPHILHKKIGIREKVKDIDFQYRNFGKELDTILPDKDEISKIFLFPQGGIDQINHALTLQLLQKFTDKVDFFQHAEKDVLRKLDFPNLFIKDLTRQKILKHLEDYDFGKAAELVFDSEELVKKLRFAADRLSLRHDYIDWNSFNDFYYIDWDSLSPIEKNQEKLKDLVYSFKIDYKQGLYNSALTKLYTIYENVYKCIVDRFVGIDTSSYYDNKIRPGERNEKWEDFLCCRFGQNFLEQLKNPKKGKSPVHLNNPNTRTYLKAVLHMIKEKKYSKVSEKDAKSFDGALNELRQLRNFIAHSLGAATKKDIDTKLRKISFDKLLDILDNFVGTSGLGPYKEIKNLGIEFYKP